MKNLIPGAVVAALAAACGGGGKTQLLDASVDALLICDPIAQTGCKGGERCTWIVDANANPTTMTSQIGHVDCVAVDPNAVARGMACTPAMAGVAGGADNCAGGDICISRVCKQICDPQLASGAGAGACDSTHACLSYRGVFESTGIAAAGACEVACDPLTQRLATTGAEACGTTDPTKPAGTCVPTTGEFKSFACAPALTGTELLTDRKAPLGDSRGFFGNGCAPGFLPFFFEDGTGAMKTLCSGMCAPAKMDSTIFANVATPANQKPYGDTSALGKLPADPQPVAGHATCQFTFKGSLTDAEGTEDCRFIWFPLATSSRPAAIVDTPYNDTLGICFAYSKFKTVDTNNDTMADAFEKSCKDLGTTADAAFGTAEQNGCYPLKDTHTTAAPGSPSRVVPNPHRVGSFRAAYGTGVVARPVFE
jgi:hypothetical protein